MKSKKYKYQPNIMGIWTQLTAVCNKCGNKDPVYLVLEKDNTLNIFVKLPCSSCSYNNLVIANSDEKVVPLGELGKLDEFEKLEPGPLNFTEKVVDFMKDKVTSVIVGLQ